MWGKNSIPGHYRRVATPVTSYFLGEELLEEFENQKDSRT